MECVDGPEQTLMVCDGMLWSSHGLHAWGTYMLWPGVHALAICLAFHASLFMLRFPCLAFHASLSMPRFPCLAFHASLSMLRFPCLAFHALLFMLRLPCLATKQDVSAARGAMHHAPGAMHHAPGAMQNAPRVYSAAHQNTLMVIGTHAAPCVVLLCTLAPACGICAVMPPRGAWAEGPSGVDASDVDASGVDAAISESTREHTHAHTAL